MGREVRGEMDGKWRIVDLTLSLSLSLYVPFNRADQGIECQRWQLTFAASTTDLSGEFLIWCSVSEGGGEKFWSFVVRFVGYS
jgi:hypothetical protein